MAKEAKEVKFVGELPERGRHSPWVERLQPLVAAPRRWAQVQEAESDEQAQNAVDNLNRRRVIIPKPDHNWSFASRGNLVFAMYGGRGRKVVKRRAGVRRT